jgi:hypothetical protein
MQNQRSKLAHILTPLEACSGSDQPTDASEPSNVTPERPKISDSGSIELAVVASNTQNEQLEEPTGLSGSHHQVCVGEYVLKPEQGF